MHVEVYRWLDKKTIHGYLQLEGRPEAQNQSLRAKASGHSSGESGRIRNSAGGVTETWDGCPNAAV